MTTNQTIDGVPRELRELLERVATEANHMLGFTYAANYDECRSAVDELRALLDAPAKPGPSCVGDLERFESDGEDFVKVGDVIDMLGNMKAAKPQGEPVAHMPVERCYDVSVKMIIAFNEAKKAGRDLDDALDAAYKSALRYSPNPMNAEQSAPVEVVPDGYCIMPRQLTDENGAKALLLGEFKLLVTKECPECCELEEPTEGCSICDGEGEYGQKHTIPWDQIKFIYSKAVSGLAVKAESTKSR